MPMNVVYHFMWKTHGSTKLTNYGGKFQYNDQRVVTRFCEHFKVSKTTAIIRLRQLGFIYDRKYSEYKNQLDVSYE